MAEHKKKWVTLAYNLRNREVEAVCVRSLAIIETETLLIEITEKMKRFDRDICPADGALQARPKVFESVSMDVALNILFCVVDHVMNVLLTKVAVRAQRVAVHGRSGFDVLHYFTVKMPPLGSLDNHRADFAMPFEQAHDGNHEISCPRCAHIHYRVVRDGKITEERWQSSAGAIYIATGITAMTGSYITFAATGSANTTAAFTSDLWLHGS